jgi:hypothetical protein
MFFSIGRAAHLSECEQSKAAVIVSANQAQAISDVEHNVAATLRVTSRVVQKARNPAVPDRLKRPAHHAGA